MCHVYIQLDSFQVHQLAKAINDRGYCRELALYLHASDEGMDVIGYDQHPESGLSPVMSVHLDTLEFTVKEEPWE